MARRNRKRIRYAVIGLGHIAQVAVLPAFRNAAKNSVLTALISDDETKLKTLSRRYKAQYLCTYEQADALFRTGEIDAVYIALPNDMHAEWTIKAANAGLHVLCEKPMATSSDDCEQMIRACERNRVKLMIAYRLHFERANLEVANLVRTRRIGDPKFFDSQFTMQVKEGNIRTQAERGGGPEWDIGIYCQNAARYVLAAEPTQVWAMRANSGDKRFREVPETVTAVLKFPNERVATFVCSFGAADRSRCEVVGTKGAVIMDPAYEYAEGLAYELTIGERKQFAPELIYFSDCILKNREPEPSGREGLIDVCIIEAMHRSMKSGAWESVQVSERRRRPSLKQQIRRPGIQKPQTVNVQQPH
ncbi:MAG: Gfo/Idh/MocA family protein [Gammaproteobacteria bacterium]